MARTSASKAEPPVFNIEDTDPYLDAEAGAWLHLEDRRDYPPKALYADPRTEQLRALNEAILARNADTKKYSDAEIAEQDAHIAALREDAKPRLPVRLKLLGLLAEKVQAKSADIDKRASALRQQRYDAAKANKATDDEAKKVAVLTEAEVAAFDGELYACAVIDSENLGYKGQAKLTEESARELFTKRADIRFQIKDFLGKLSEFKRVHVVH